MASWLKALSKTRTAFSGATRALFGQSKAELNEVDLEELEEALLKADVSPRLAGEWISKLDRKARRHADGRRGALRDLLIESLQDDRVFAWDSLAAPTTVLLLGINGAGKTTTCAKLGLQARNAGRKPLLAAGDTFRAAGTEQVRLWGEKLGLPVVSGQQGADAASVAYDALNAAQARDVDLVLIDTAGRMHTKEPLMQELNKICRALEKCREGAPEETWIVLDGSNGQNALFQAREFNKMVPLTGVVVTKLDGSSKAGFLFSVKRELGVPILFVGLGEQAEDLVPFEAASFVDALLGTPETQEA